MKSVKMILAGLAFAALTLPAFAQESNRDENGKIGSAISTFLHEKTMTQNLILLSSSIRMILFFFPLDNRHAEPH